MICAVLSIPAGGLIQGIRAGAFRKIPPEYKMSSYYGKDLNGWQVIVLGYFIFEIIGAIVFDGQPDPHTHFSMYRELFDIAVSMFVLWRAGLWKVK